MKASKKDLFNFIDLSGQEVSKKVLDALRELIEKHVPANESFKSEEQPTCSRCLLALHLRQEEEDMKVTKEEMLNYINGNYRSSYASDAHDAIRDLIEKHVPDDPKPVWKPEEIGWENYLTIDALTGSILTNRLNNAFPQTGFCRPNETDACYFFDQIVKPMSLIALRAYQIDPEWQADWEDADWEDEDQEKFYVWFDYSCGVWCNNYTKYVRRPGVPYMSRATAKQVCEELNSGYLQVGIGGQENDR